MRMLGSWMIAAALSLPVLAPPAQAQVTQISTSNPMPKGRDPDAKICERELKTGSRLEQVTVCMTAREWKDLRQGHRQDVERVQRTINMPLSN